MSIHSKILAIGCCLSLTSSYSINAQKIFMTGDSHVFSKIYPAKVEETLRTQHPDIEFSWWAKNGICFHSFNSSPEYFDSIVNFQPELLIVHLGTNGAYNNNFSKAAFHKEIEKFYTTLTDYLPEIKVVFITPFTNKKRKYRKRGKWRINYRNREVSEEIISFVAEHPKTFIIDNNAEVGLKFLKSKTLIRPDNVHLTEAGYKVLGEQVGTQLLGIETLWTDANPE